MAETIPETIPQTIIDLRGGGFGGTLIMIGDEAHRPYDRPATSKELLSGGLELERVFLKRDQFYTDKNIDVRLGVSVTAIDRAAHRITLSTGEALAYDKLVIATGARVRR
jgi:3-phenylpropionate/trans-cinnamate dioxygenase ferredoxin reductase subunit